jgi:hypothetical protein
MTRQTQVAQRTALTTLSIILIIQAVTSVAMVGRLLAAVVIQVLRRNVQWRIVRESPVLLMKERCVISAQLL